MCTETPKHIWYILIDGMWNKLEGTSKIRSLVNSNLIPLYRNHLNYLTHKHVIEKLSEDDAIRTDFNIEIVNNIIKKLKTFSYVTDIIHQSIQYFKQDKFIEKLDANPDIICFGNELFDLKTCEWRTTMPTDFCSYKCGVSKEQINNANVPLLNKIFLDIFTTQERVDYMFNEFSMFLNGNNLRQLFYIWCGVGANGKSFVQDFFNMLLVTIFVK